MKKLLYIICMCLAVISCERRELTYNYSPYCDVEVNLDWSNMSKAPNGVTVICYPESGEEPIIKVNGDNISKEVLQLPAGIYNIIAFNRSMSDFDYVKFRGMDKFETAEVYACSTTSKWAKSKAESTLVSQPDEVAAATYCDVEIKQECIEKSTALYKSEGKRLVAATLKLKPVVVVKEASVRIQVEGIHNLYSTRATLTGMADGYNFSTQKSCTSTVTHALESWKIEPFEYGQKYGETNTTFVSFGITDYYTPTRAEANKIWKGTADVSMLLVDRETVCNFNNIPLEHRISIDDFTGALTTTLHINIGYTYNEDDVRPVLPDVKPQGGTESGFDATIDPWGDDIVTTVPI